MSRKFAEDASRVDPGPDAGAGGRARGRGPVTLASPDTRRTARAIVRSWRELTGPGGGAAGGRAARRGGDAGRSTLVACSGGGDSTALAAALAWAGLGRRIVLAHVVHDLRPPEESRVDAEAVRRLADRLGVRCVERAVRCAGAKVNAESAARRARYRALWEVARAEGFGWIATGHQADDQLETLVMRLVRGAGPAGLGGVRAVRDLGGGVRAVRPMLGVTRAEARRLCEDAGLGWAEDRTNADTLRARSAVRHGVLPALEALDGGSERAARRAARSAELLADAAGLVGERAAAVLARAGRGPAGERVWPRRDLAAERAVVVGETLRLAAWPDGAAGRDAARVLERAVRAVREGVDGVRVFEAGGGRVVVRGAEVRAGSKKREARSENEDPPR